ncbi:MAG: response regulator [Patescibacteria group bacterium]
MSAKPKVLLVYQEHQERFVIQKFFELDKNAKVMMANNGFEGFDLAVNMSPDIIIAYSLLDGVSALELCRKVRADKRSVDIPIIAFGMLTGPISASDVLEAGANFFITQDEEFLYWLGEKVDKLLA